MWGAGQSSVPVGCVTNVLLLAVVLISRNPGTALPPNCYLGACFCSYLSSLSPFLTAAVQPRGPHLPCSPGLFHAHLLCVPQLSPLLLSVPAEELLPRGSANVFVEIRSNETPCFSPSLQLRGGGTEVWMGGERAWLCCAAGKPLGSFCVSSGSADGAQGWAEPFRSTEGGSSNQFCLSSGASPEPGHFWVAVGFLCFIQWHFQAQLSTWVLCAVMQVLDLL